MRGPTWHPSMQHSQCLNQNMSRAIACALAGAWWDFALCDKGSDCAPVIRQKSCPGSWQHVEGGRACCAYICSEEGDADSILYLQ